MKPQKAEEIFATKRHKNHKRIFLVMRARLPWSNILAQKVFVSFVPFVAKNIFDE